MAILSMHAVRPPRGLPQLGENLCTGQKESINYANCTTPNVDGPLRAFLEMSRFLPSRCI